MFEGDSNSLDWDIFKTIASVCVFATQKKSKLFSEFAICSSVANTCKSVSQKYPRLRITKPPSNRFLWVKIKLR